MEIKPLVINTNPAPQKGSQFKWNKLEAPDNFISTITTPDIDVENSDELNSLISGIPSPMARAQMFKYAINYVSHQGEELKGLLAFYKTLQDEWKGLIACLALDNQPITVEKVYLTYSGGKSIYDTTNLYEPKGAFGNMLFDSKELWCDPKEFETNPDAHPFISIIRYNGIVIAGTNPDSLLFTAPVYNLDIIAPYYRKQKTAEGSGKFIDPIKLLSEEDLQKLYSYVKHISTSLDDFKNSFGKNKPETQKFAKFINNWLIEIKNKSNSIDENAIVPNFGKFYAPFDKLFNYKTTLYGYNGRITSNLETLNLPNDISPIEVDLSDLLLEPASTTVTEITFDEPIDALNVGVYLLKAVSDRGEKYFSLPLSEKGLTIFQDNIEGLLQSSGDFKSNLSAIFDMSTKTLHVTLQIDVNGNPTSFKKEYKDPVKIEGQRIICWPDFVSKIWNQYYLYSELPHNSADLKAYPLRGDVNNFQLISEVIDGKYQFKKIAENGNIISKDDTAEILIEYDINKLGAADLKYEIYQSAQPFKGVEFKFKSKPSGYLVFKSILSNNSNTLKDYRIRTNLIPVRVGFDFGSNNTCISYAEQGGRPELITYKNRRKFLLGVEGTENNKRAAAPHEVFFFQNDDTASNQIKSMLMIHDERRVKDIEKGPKIILTRAVTGGLPVFEKNIPIDDGTESTYTTRFAGQPNYIKYNMKWSNDEKENAYKQGLLKSLYLKTYAELLDKERFPESLAWAYPSSMNKQILLKYGLLWNDIGQLNPLNALLNSSMEFKNARVAQFTPSSSNDSSRRSSGSFGSSSIQSSDIKAMTEAASVCKHALGVGFETGPRGLIIGFDIGGSTTDILCIALKKDKSSNIPDDFQNSLIKQSSIKFAAGKLADATKESKKFQEVLKSFCLYKDFHIHGINVGVEKLNRNTSAYYYNLIIDRLNSETELNDFYKRIADGCPELFTINAYMTGLIMFYAGQLARKIRETQDANPADYLDVFDDVQIGCFGKGGRMFDWLRSLDEQSCFNYYQDCFDSGYGIKAQDHVKRFNIKPSSIEYVKSEVSFGLSRHNEIKVTDDQITELLGEDGYTYNGEILDSMSSVESRFMQAFGDKFTRPREFKRLNDFVKIFTKFNNDYFVKLPSLESEVNGMRLQSYVQNIPEYQLAKRSQEFDYEAPVIILEGMCFMDEVLMKKLFS